MSRQLIIALALFAGTGNLVFAQEVKTNPPVNPPPPVNVIKQEDEKQLEITVTDNRMKITNATIGSKVEIFSVVGVKVKEIEMKEASGEYQLNIAKGYYIVRIGETTRKLVIR